MSVTREVFQREMSLLKDDAVWNMLFILVTCEVSQPEMSPLNVVL